MLKELIFTCERLLAPPNCHACGTLLYERLNAFDANVCRACAEGIPLMPPHACPLCGHPVRSARDFTAGRCPACRDIQPGFDRQNACFVYNGTARRLIHQFKYQGRAYLARTLARLMLTVIHKEAVSVFDALVPVPLTATRLRERTGDEAEDGPVAKGKPRKPSFFNGESYRGYKISLRLVSEGLDEHNPVRIESAEDVYKFMKALGESDRERLYSLCLDGKSEL